MFVKWSFTSLLTKQTCFTFSGTAKRATQKFVGAISFHYAEINQMCSYYKERYKGNEERLEFKLCDQWFNEACFEKKPTFITFFFTIL